MTLSLTIGCRARVYRLCCGLLYGGFLVLLSLDSLARADGDLTRTSATLGRAPQELADLTCPPGTRFSKGKPFLFPDGSESSISGMPQQQTKGRAPGLLPDPKLAKAFRPAAFRAQSAAIDSDQIAQMSTDQGAGFRRLAIWGDSHLASGVFVEALARSLGQQGIPVVTTFIPPYMSRRGVRLPLRAFCLSDDWIFKSTYQADGASDTGPALAEMRSRARQSSPPQLALSESQPISDLGAESSRADRAAAYLGIDLRDEEKQSRVSSLSMLYRALHRPLELALSINQEAERLIRIEPAAEPLTVEKLYIEPADGEPLSTIGIRVVTGELAFQGFDIEHDTSPVLSIDTLAFPGATVKGWAQLNPHTLGNLIGSRPYDAVMLEYGTNEAAGDFDPGQYTETLHHALTKLRAVLPNAPCLLIGAPDRGSALRVVRPDRTGKAERVGKSERAQRMKYAQIHKQLNAIQAQVAAQYGCHNWDWQLAMGGTGAAYRWAGAKPALMSRDLIHLTADGYRQSAEALTKKIGWAPSLAPDKASTTVAK